MYRLFLATAMQLGKAMLLSLLSLLSFAPLLLQSLPELLHELQNWAATFAIMLPTSSFVPSARFEMATSSLSSYAVSAVAGLSLLRAHMTAVPSPPASVARAMSLSHAFDGPSTYMEPMLPETQQVQPPFEVT